MTYFFERSFTYKMQLSLNAEFILWHLITQRSCDIQIPNNSFGTLA